MSDYVELSCFKLFLNILCMYFSIGIHNYLSIICCSVHYKKNEKSKKKKKKQLASNTCEGVSQSTSLSAMHHSVYTDSTTQTGQST